MDLSVCPRVGLRGMRVSVYAKSKVAIALYHGGSALISSRAVGALPVH